MNSSAFTPEPSFSAEELEVRGLYRRLIEGWNNRSSSGMAEPFAEEGELIGYDGSQLAGRAEIVAHLQQIFADHPTAPFVVKIKGVSFLTPDCAILRAIAGMVPIGKSDIDSRFNAHQTLVAVSREGAWSVALFQNTPAQFHGRPELVEQMTQELRNQLEP